MPNTITLKSFGGVPYDEKVSVTAVITPGMLLELTSANKVRPHYTASGAAQALFALENDLEGQTIDDTYAIGDIVLCRLFRPGDEVNALIADGQNIAIGDYLESAGTGYLQKYVADIDIESSMAGANQTFADKQIVAQALAAVDMSGSSEEDPSARCRVRIV